MTTWATPAARLVLRADAPRDAWLAERTTGIGGTDAAALIGANRWSNPYKVWQEKTGQGDDWAGNDATRRGQWLEGHLAAWFAEEAGVAVRRTGLLRCRRQPWVIGNPDRLTGDGGVLECKVTGVHTADADSWQSGQPTRLAYAQAQWYLSLTGRTCASFAAYVDPSPMRVGPVDRDEALIATMREAAEQFWHDHVLTRTPPPVDWSTVTDAEVDARWPAVDPGATTDVDGPAADLLRLSVEQLADVQADLTVRGREIRNLERVRDGLRTRLRAAAAGREWLALDGHPVARWATTTAKGEPLAGRIDTTALRAAHPDIAAEFTRPASPRFALITEDNQ